jgi:hypothetical protein
LLWPGRKSSDWPGQWGNGLLWWTAPSEPLRWRWGSSSLKEMRCNDQKWDAGKTAATEVHFPTQLQFEQI